MKNIFGKIKNRAKSIIIQFKNDINFSYKLAIVRFIGTVAGLCRFHRVSNACSLKAQKIISGWLYDFLQPAIKDIERKSNSENAGQRINSPVWICWWQGEELAPAIVKKCISSIRRHAAAHPVILIDKSNYSEYVHVPAIMLEKMNAEKMCVAHFSDYLRLSLLKKYGGLWIDATIFLTQDIPDEYFMLPFFSCNAHRELNKSLSVSNGRWTSFFLASYPRGEFVYYAQGLLEYYWLKQDSAIDYLFLDYIFDIVYTELPQCKKMVDNIPLNNLDRNKFAGAMVNGISANEFSPYDFSDTLLFKLSYREHYPERTESGRDTVYSAFLKGYYDTNIKEK